MEAWIALGATSRGPTDAVRRATYEALAPALDQTRTTGLVTTLPGAFIGALLRAGPAPASRASPAGSYWPRCWPPKPWSRPSSPNVLGPAPSPTHSLLGRPRLIADRESQLCNRAAFLTVG